MRSLIRTAGTAVLATLVLVAYGTLFAQSGRPVISPTYPTPAPRVGSDCLHDTGESSEQAARRQQALILARAITTTQMRQTAAAGRFLDRAALLEHLDISRIAGDQGKEVAPGWQLHLAASAERYVFSIKDTTDPCHFAYFSDDSGLIYEAKPIS